MIPESFLISLLRPSVEFELRVAPSRFHLKPEVVTPVASPECAKIETRLFVLLCISTRFLTTVIKELETIALHGIVETMSDPSTANKPYS
jgi:hypothetical protein